MTSLRFDLSSILKILNLSLLWFIERSGSENHGIGDVLRHRSIYENGQNLPLSSLKVIICKKYQA